MTILWFDCETYSECDLKTHSTHRYAEHPSTEVTIVQWAIDDGEPSVQDLTCHTRPGREIVRPGLLALLNDPRVTIIAHNSHFDRTVLRHVWGIDIPVERWMDTMIQAMAHGLPGGLDKIGEVLGLEEDVSKDKRGKQLIQMFCKPAPKGQTIRRKTRDTHPQEWAEFLEYSRQDIVAMREISHRLPSWNYKPNHPELTLWHLDQKINDRGFCVDTKLALAATDAAEKEKARLKVKVSEVTMGDVESVSKRDALLKHIVEYYGVDLPDMKSDTLKRRIEDPELPEAVKLLLSIRLEATKTSTAKYKALTNAASGDGRLRNTMQFAGAQRTTRWAGRVFQPQNMPRPDMGHIANWAGTSVKNLTDELTLQYIDQGVNALKLGVADIAFNDVMKLTANLVRSCIIAPPGRKLCIADLANIEGRVLAWAAGESWKLKAFAEYDAGTGPDLYNVAYGRSFNVDPKTVKGQQRQIGKVQELGLGYEGGVAAFLTFAAVYQMDLNELADAVHSTADKSAIAQAYIIYEWAAKKRRTLGLERNVYVACEVLKKSWRDAHPATVALWKGIGEATRQAIQNPGVTYDVRMLKIRRDGAWLRIRLPSGRYLCYTQPQVAEDGQISYMGVNQYTRRWSRIKTYGGKLVENIVQAIARDVLAHNMGAIDQQGYSIVLSVHDELLTETDDTDEFSHEELAQKMSINPPWAEGLPLSAAGFETTRYRKD